MFPQGIAKLFRAARPVEADGLLAQIDALPNGQLPSDKLLYVLSGGSLAGVYSDKGPPKRKTGERWWLVPREDLPLEVFLDIEDARLKAQLKVRFETDSDLLSLLSGRNEVTAQDIGCLVASQLASLLDAEQEVAPEMLIAADETARERLRAKLSLLLQTRGMRCTELGPFERAAPAEVVAADTSSMLKDLPIAAAVETAVAQVKTSDDWATFAMAFEEDLQGLEDEAGDELDRLGAGLVAGKTSPRAVSKRLEEMAHEAVHRAGIPRPDLDRFRGLELRLPAFEESAASNSKSVAQPRPAGLPVRLGRRPWTWWTFNKRSADERLQRFSEQAIGQLRSALDAQRRQLKGPELVKVRALDQRLQLAKDMLESVPLLAPPQANLRLSRHRVKELVRSAERGVTAIELLAGHTRRMSKAAPGSPAWLESADAASAALGDVLESMRERREVHLAPV